MNEVDKKLNDFCYDEFGRIVINNTELLNKIKGEKGEEILNIPNILDKGCGGANGSCTDTQCK